MKLSVYSTRALGEYYLEALDYSRINFDLDQEFDLSEGWYKLVIKYAGVQTDISDIKINDQSINYYIYTGFFIEKATNETHQPATALWTEGEFNIWIHTNLGFMIQKLEESIRPGEHGSNLFDKYILTVDRPIKIDKTYRKDVQAYFENANGPRWWRKGDVNTPVEPCDKELLAGIDKQTLIKELENNFTVVYSYDILGKDNRPTKVTAKKLKQSNELPFIDTNDIPGDITRELCRRLGYKRILNITFNVMPAGGSFWPHIDDFWKKNTIEHLMGANNFLWSLADDQDNNLFKLGEAGVLPIGNGAFVNLGKYSHASVNQTDSERILLTIHGDRGLTNNQKML